MSSKLDVLKETLGKLNSGKFKYEWGRMGQCNCGIVSQVALGESAKQVESAFEDSQVKGPWTDNLRVFDNRSMKKTCSVTGQKVFDIVKTLFNQGFTKDELIHLEWLSDPKVRQRAQAIGKWEHQEIDQFSDHFYAIREGDSSNESRGNLKLYLAAWIQILEEKEAKKQVKETIVEQSISNDLKHDKKETPKTLVHEH